MKPDCVYCNTTCTMGKYLKLDCPCISYRKDPEKKIDGYTQVACLKCGVLEKKVAELEAQIAELTKAEAEDAPKVDEPKRKPGRPRK